MNTNTRNIPVTMLMSEDEYGDFKKACSAADIKHSVLLRDLSHAWMRRQPNVRRAVSRRECRGHMQHIPISAPGGKGSFHVRL